MNVLIASLLLALGASPAPAQAPAPAVEARAYENSGPFAVATVLYDWKDSSRNRPVPVKIYYPKTGKGPFPVIVFSHGLGGSRESYEYIGRHWASHGYVSVHVQHLGSDDAVWRVRDLSLADPCVKAGIDMSPPVPKNGQDLDRAYGGIKIPLLHMTGTLDNSPIGDTTAEERRIPFDHIRGVDQYLVTFEGGDHMIFSGRARSEPTPRTRSSRS